MPSKYRLCTSLLAFALSLATGCTGPVAGEAAGAHAVPHDDAGAAPAGGAPPARAPTLAAPARGATAEAGSSTKAGILGRNVLAYPDDLQMSLLAYRLTGRTPPLEAWAGEQNSVRTANEFTRADQLRAETATLAAVYDSTEDIGFLQMRLRSQLSQYDAAKGGYYLTVFAPGGTFGFKGREKVDVRLENGSEAYFWAMDAARAEEILDDTGSSQHNRSVTIDAKIRLLGTERRTYGLLIKGRIVEYAIYGTRRNEEPLLASFSLE